MSVQGPMIERTCDHCGAGFTVLARVLRQGRGKNCSRACAAASMRGRPSPSGVRITVSCPCGKAFEVVPSTLEMQRGKYCSVECSNAFRRKPLPTAAAEQSPQPKPAKPSRPTSITPKAADRVVPVDDDKGGAVLCARCRQPRGRGELCRRCEWRAFEQEVAS